MNKKANTMMEILPWIEKKQDLPGVILTDVTSRDGLQSLPWYNYWTKEQRGILTQKLADLGIPHIEVGFPALEGDPEYEAVDHTANQIGERETVVMGLARLIESDITNVISSLSSAQYKGVHTFIGTSPEHLSTFSLSQKEILENVEKRVSQIREAGYIAEFSAEDATRTEIDFLIAIYEKALKGGAQILNIPDTVGCYDVEQYTKLLEHLNEKFPHAIFSTHTHNDKSQAEQSALVSVKKKFANRIEGTLFGIGERAGNTDLSTLIPIILQDREYSDMAKNMLRGPESDLKKKFPELLNYMQNISGIHMRPVAPGYGYESIVNRSGIHQAKVAKVKNSYIVYPGDRLGIGGRPKIEISPLSGYNGVKAKFSETFQIEISDDNAKILTDIFRHIFSPDTDPESIHTKFQKLSSKFLYNIGLEIHDIKEEARKLKNTSENIEKWNTETDNILRQVYDEYFSERN